MVEGLHPAGRLDSAASAFPGDRKFFQVKTGGYHKNRDGCVVCKEIQGRFFKIHKLEFCQQKHFVAKVPAPESEYSVKADYQNYQPEKPFCGGGKGGGQCYFFCDAFLYRRPVETQVKGFQQESPDGGNHVEFTPQTAVGKIEKVKYIPGKHQGCGNGA